MTKQTRPKKDDPEKSRLFIKKAQELRADKEEPDADALIQRLVQKKPEPHRRDKSR
jgi:hypothetical protein